MDTLFTIIYGAWAIVLAYGLAKRNISKGEAALQMGLSMTGVILVVIEVIL